MQTDYKQITWINLLVESVLTQWEGNTWLACKETLQKFICKSCKQTIQKFHLQKRGPSYTLGGDVSWCKPLWKTVWRFLKKLKVELPYDPVIPLLGMFLEKTLIRKDTCTPIFIAALLTKAKTWKQPRYPLTDERIKMWLLLQSLRRVWLFATLWTVARQTPLSMGFQGRNNGVGHHFLPQGIFPTQGSNPCLLHWEQDSLPLSHQGSPYMEYYSAIKEWNNASCSNMNGPRDYHTKWSQRQTYDITYMESKKKDKNEIICKTGSQP